MATQLRAGDVWKVRIANRMNDQTAYNVLHFLVQGVQGDQTTDQDMIDQMNAAVSPLYRSVLNTHAQYWGFEAQRVNPGPLSFPVHVTTPATSGSTAGDPLPQQVCGIVTWTSALAGRSFRGRSYLAFPSEDDNGIDDIPGNLYQAAADALASRLRQPWSIVHGAQNATVVLGIYHRKLGNFTVLTGHVVRRRWATQRSRGNYGRPNAEPW